VITSGTLAVYLVTDEPSRYTGDFLDAVDDAVAGGVTVVQYRDTESDDRTQYTRARRLAGLLRGRGVPLIVNNSPALALAVGADGVHLGQSDLPADVVRRIVGPGCVIGLSITCAEEARAVDPACVDYVGIGPVYDATATKPDAASAMGLVVFAEIRRRLESFPAVAIGGMTLDRAPAVYASGADGLAMVSAFSRATDPAGVARAFRDVHARRGGEG